MVQPGAEWRYSKIRAQYVDGETGKQGVFEAIDLFDERDVIARSEPFEGDPQEHTDQQEQVHAALIDQLNQANWRRDYMNKGTHWFDVRFKKIEKRES